VRTVGSQKSLQQATDMVSAKKKRVEEYEAESFEETEEETVDESEVDMEDQGSTEPSRPQD
jgi:hypothetical protein